jgi:DNA-binding NtrC family response regulator
VIDVPKRVLVVDDDRAMVRSMCDVLRLAGWESEAAFSGEAAIQRVQESSYSAVLMDVRMGGMSGVEALQAIRARRPTLPVILMTAYSPATQLREAEMAGVQRVFQKPVPIPALLELLAACTEARRAVLVVDDDANFLRTISAVLTAHGCVVRTAQTLERALSELEAHPLSMVLLDLKLDDLTPKDVVAAISRASSGAAVIAFSGNPQLLEESFVRAPSAHIVGRLTKPFSPDQLTQLLDAIIA